MNKPIVLIGGGGHCKSVIEAILSSGRTILGILDMPEKLGESILGYKIIGSNRDIPTYVDKAEFIISVGQIEGSNIRRKIANLICQANGICATVIASSAVVSRFAKLGEGTVVLHGAVVNADAKIGVHNIINTLSNVEHDVTIGDFCHVSTGTMVNGGCQIGSNTFIGSQSVLRNHIEIVENTVIAAGSFVRKSILDSGLYSGSPAKLVKKH